VLGAITVLVLCQLAGEAIVRLFGLPLPGPVAGMVILFIGLLIKGGVPKPLDRVTRGILGNLGLLFVPASVGVMVQTDILVAEAGPIAAAVLISTPLTMVVSGLTMQWLDRRARKDQP